MNSCSWFNHLWIWNSHALRRPCIIFRTSIGVLHISFVVISTHHVLNEVIYLQWILPVELSSIQRVSLRFNCNLIDVQFLLSISLSIDLTLVLNAHSIFYTIRSLYYLYPKQSNRNIVALNRLWNCSLHFYTLLCSSLLLWLFLVHPTLYSNLSMLGNHATCSMLQCHFLIALIVYNLPL